MSTRKKWAVAINGGEKVSQPSQKAVYQHAYAQAGQPGVESVDIYVDEGGVQGGRWGWFEHLDAQDLALIAQDRG